MTAFQQLLTVLRAEHNSAQQLLAILNKERHLLISSESDEILHMSALKQTLLSELEQLARQQEIILQSEGFPTGKDGLEAYIANQTTHNAQQLNEVVDGLRVTANQCRDNNQINGGIVNVNRQYLHRALSLLRGRDTEVTAYGPGGEYTNQVVRQPLIGRV
jgi:flagella synthesis protein FlgN